MIEASLLPLLQVYDAKPEPAFKVTDPPHWVTSDPIFTEGIALIVTTELLEAAEQPSTFVTTTE